MLDDAKISKSLGQRHRAARARSTSTASTRCASGCARRCRSARTGTLSLDELHERYERELGNDLGNLLSRTTAMIARYRGGASPRSRRGPVRARTPRSRARSRARRGSTPGISPARSRRSGRSSAGSTATSRQTKPWELAKDDARVDELDAAFSTTLADGLRASPSRSSPYLPETSRADPRGPRTAGRPRLGERRARP